MIKSMFSLIETDSYTENNFFFKRRKCLEFSVLISSKVIVCPM